MKYSNEQDFVNDVNQLKAQSVNLKQASATKNWDAVNTATRIIDQTLNDLV